MFATSGDILNMSLALGFIVLVIFLSIFLFYGILILRDVSKSVDEVSEIIDKIHKTIISPLRAIDYLVEKATPYFEAIIDSKLKRKK